MSPYDANFQEWYNNEVKLLYFMIIKASCPSERVPNLVLVIYVDWVRSVFLFRPDNIMFRPSLDLNLRLHQSGTSTALLNYIITFTFHFYDETFF